MMFCRLLIYRMTEGLQLRRSIEHELTHLVLTPELYNAVESNSCTFRPPWVEEPLNNELSGPPETQAC